MSRLEKALEAARRGHRVHPLHNPAVDGCSCGDSACRSVGKHPRFRGWQSKSTTDEATIRQWWATWPDANVGIAVVRGCGYWVLDVDPRNGGDETLDALEKKHGPLPETLTTLTGSGGAHLFFKHPAGDVVWRGRVGDGVDVKGTGGSGANLVGPGSTHHSGGAYSVAIDAPMAEAPEWLLNLATRRKEEPKKGAPPATGEELDALVDYARKRMAKRPPGVEGESGGTACLLAARFLYVELALPDAYARPILDEWLGRCQPPWTDERQIQHKIQDALRSPSVSPGCGLSDFRVWRAFDEPEREADLPTVRVDGKHHVVVDEVVSAVARHPQLYQMGRQLVEVLHVEAVDRPQGSQDLWRPASTPQVHQIGPPRMDILLSQSLNMEKWSSTEEDYIQTNQAPAWLIPAVLAKRAEWPGVRELRAIGDAPAILPDGSLVTRRGYHAGSGLFLGSNFELDVPEHPTQSQAMASANALLDLVSEFPFVDDNHRAAWLAALLTPLGKFAFDGNAPFMLFEAAAAASGKTLLVELVAQIAFGQKIARTPWSDDDSEIRKKITTCIQDGDRMVLFDNVTNGSTLKSSALDAALTSPVWKDRKLGSNENVGGPNEVVFFASGNNLSVGGDLERRTLYCRLESPEDDPGQRAQRFKYDLSTYPAQHRSELLGHCMTVLRAHIQAGCPQPTVDGRPVGLMASFEGWSRVVRWAAARATGCDPLATRAELQQVADRTRSAAFVMVSELVTTFGGKEFTAKDVLNAIYPHSILSNGEAREDLRDAIEELCNARPGQKVTAVQVGHQLRKIRGRRFQGVTLKLADQGTQHRPGNWVLIS